MQADACATRAGKINNLAFSLVSAKLTNRTCRIAGFRPAQVYPAGWKPALPDEKKYRCYENAAIDFPIAVEHRAWERATVGFRSVFYTHEIVPGLVTDNASPL